MNRNIHLFVCICLAAGFFVIHFHRPAPNLTVASNRDAIQSVDPLPVTTNAAIEPVAEALSVEQNVDSTAATDTAALNPPSIPEEKAPETDKYELLRELSALAAQHPEEALAAAMELPEGEERTEALTAVCRGLAETNPEDAVKLAQDLHLDEQPAAIMEDLVQKWATADLASSLAWAAAQPAGAPRDEYTTRIAFIMSQTTPSDAASLVVDQIPVGPARDEAIMTVLHQWANQNMVVAANWANQVASGPLQERVINELNGILEYQQALTRP